MSSAVVNSSTLGESEMRELKGGHCWERVQPKGNSEETGNLWEILQGCSVKSSLSTTDWPAGSVSALRKGSRLRNQEAPGPSVLGPVSQPPK